MQASWKVILAFIGIFLAGAVTGGTVSYHWIRSNRSGPPPQGPRVSIEQFVRNQQELMTKKLRLTDEQVARITPILSQASKDLRKLHEEGSRMTDQVLERQDHDILKVLTPEQQKKFGQLRREQKDRFEQQRRERTERLRKQPQPGAQHGRKGLEEPNQPPPPPPPANEGKGAAPEPAPTEPAPKP